MVKEPLISVIIPAYNHDKYIADAINSVVNQTYKNWEMIVIDDGSIDDTYQVILESCKDEPRIKPLRNELNQGVSATRNYGVACARGEWIAFLDSDDKWDPMKLEKQMRVVSEISAMFVFTGATCMNESGKMFKGVFRVPRSVTFKELKHQNVISTSSVLIRKEYFQFVKMEKDEIHEDYLAWLRILKMGIKAYGVDEPLHTYRVYRKSKSGKKISSVKMTYQVFRCLHMKPLESAYFTMRHVLAASKKYLRVLVAKK